MKFKRTLDVVCLLTLVCSLVTFPTDARAAGQHLKSQPGPSFSPEKRIDLLISQMTLDEKLQMVAGVSAGKYAGYIPAIQRLGIPALYMLDGSGGVRMEGTTALPAPIAMAATWDPKMASVYGDVIGRETRAVGANVALSPMVNIDRTAQAGRNFESLGEDPYLDAQLVAPEVIAMQKNHVIATTKHYAANNQENGRLRDSSNVDMRTFHELYLPAFVAAANAGSGSVMCSYNQINEKWACENKQILDILKQENHFAGFVMSDWGATHSTAPSANAGLDMEMPGGKDGFFRDALRKAIESGSVSPSRLDDQVRRILRTIFEVQLFQYPAKAEPVAESAGRRDALQIAEQSAVLLKNESHLLPIKAKALHSIALIGAAMDADLRGGSAWVGGTGTVSPMDAIREVAGTDISVNYAWAQGVPFISPLPTVDSFTLTPSGSATGIHGVRAAYYSNEDLSGQPAVTRTEPTVYANWQFAAPKEIRSETYSVRWTGTFTPPVSGTYTFGIESRNGSRLFFDGEKISDSWKPDYSIKTSTFTRNLVANHPYPFAVEAHGKINLYQMCRLLWQPPAGAPMLDIEHAVDVARHSDIAIVFAGEFRTEQYDRSTIALSGMQEEMIRAVAKANPNTIVVLNNGGPIAAGSWEHDVHSILDMWYPGEENGHALAALLFGKVNPSGRLPVTFPSSPDETASTVHWPAEPYDGESRAVNYDEKLNIGYRWYDAHDIKPLFPFGYGLSYTNFSYSHLTVSHVDSDSNFSVAFDVTNTGKLAGAEVPQLYLGYPKEAGEPVKVLRGFKKITLLPGRTQRVVFQLHPHDFSIWDVETNDWKHIAGTYEVSVGPSSRNLPLAKVAKIE